MTTENRNELPAWEAQINALLDNELDEASAAALKQAAEKDHELARAIIEAYQLQNSMESVGIEQAPASLRRKLRAIPRNTRQYQWSRRWTLTASIPLLVVILLLLQPQQPSRAEVEQARQDLAVAFTYIDKVGLMTGERIQQLLGSELRRDVTGNISKYIPFTEQSRKEKNT